MTKVVATAGQPAYLQTVSQNTAVMSNPGAGIITANGTSNEIDWIVDAGVQRTDSLGNFSNGAPTLYAYNALTMQPLWSSAYEELDMGGKYNSIADVRGNILVGTDRIQAFGITGNTIVDDAVTGTGANQFNYSGTGWQHLTGTATMGTFDGSVSTDSTQGDSATLTFTGSQIKVYSNEKSGYGSATFTVDGAHSSLVSLTPVNSSPNGLGAGDVAVYTVSGLTTGTHTLKILNASATNTISIDRVEITPVATTHAQLGLSVTDGNAIPVASGLIPYTINYNNAGSVVNGTGVNATGVVITETVPPNSSFDSANSTSGWTLASGNGSAGSIYNFSVGALNAGITGSVVFSVDLNSVIPAGTTTITNNISITDSAADTVTASRVTPVPPPAETKLIFTTQPPANGGAGVPLSPAVVVTAQDQFGNTYSADSGSTVTLTLNGGTFQGGGTTATATVSSGVATFNNLVISAAGTYTLTATDGALASINSVSFTVSANAKLAITQQPPATATAGAIITPAVKVAVETQAGAVVTTDTSTVTLTINHGLFANGSTTTTATAVNGIATFSNLVINAVGSYTLVATDGVLLQAQTNSFAVAAQASKLVFTQQPSSAGVNQSINPAVAVSLEDSFGNVDTGNTSAVTLTLSSGTFFGGATTATVNAVNGVAKFSNLVIATAGNYTLTATATSLTSAVSNSFAVSTHTLLSIDDNNANNIQTGTTNRVIYTAPANWVQSTTSLANNFDGTVTTDSQGGDTANVTFSGSLVTLYAVESPTAGSIKVFIDGGNVAEVNLSLTNSASMIAPAYTSGLLSAGTHTVSVTVVAGSVAIDRFVVGPATPTISWATPADLTYGTTLDGTELDATANVPGTFAYTPAAGTLLTAGQGKVLSAVFTPTDTTNYGTTSASVLINVQKSTPVITWPEPDDLDHGDPLSANQLDATANVAGTFVYNPPLGTVLPTGPNQILNATFTPQDTADYNTVNAQTRVDVNAIDPVITWNTPANIIDGTALSATQLNATADVPGVFVYTPAVGTILPVGNNQQINVSFTPNDTVNYNVVNATVNVNVVYGPASKLGFIQQPTSANSGATITPAVKVAVRDSAGSTLPTDTSTVTLTLSGGTFTGGGTTVSAQAVNGVATFGSLNITTNGAYTLTASDGSLNASVSNTFNIGSFAYVNFNAEATDYTAQFLPNTAGVAGGSNFVWNSSNGVNDNTGATAGGGLRSSSNADSTAIYTGSTFNLSDHAVHTEAMFVTAPAGLGSGDRDLQLGYVVGSGGAFNGQNSFISARIYGNRQVEFQSCFGTNAAVAMNTTTPTGTINNGDWLQLVFTTKEVSSGSFQGTFSVLDYGPTGVGVPTQVLAQTSYSVSGLTTIGTGSTMYAGFRTANSGAETTPLKFDNFSVDNPASRLAYLSQPTSGAAWTPMSQPFVAALEDPAGNIIVGDTSTITLTLSHGTFSNGQASVSATAVNGIASFGNLQINAAGSYILRATDSNPNLDPGFAPFVITGPTVVGRQLFYGNDKAMTTDSTGDSSVATNLNALLAGQTGAAGAGNISAYDKGINGVMIDLANGNNNALTASDFAFAVSTTGAAGSWVAAPAPTNITVRGGAGVAGAERVTITWADNAIQNTWLRVTMKSDIFTKIGADDTFYFGNLIADTDSSGAVDLQDYLTFSGNFHNSVGATGVSVGDFNGDGTVDLTDYLDLAKNFHGTLTFFAG